MERGQKESMVKKVSEGLDNAQGVIFLDYTGLTVEESNGFRRMLQKEDITYISVKNTLLARALDGRSYAELADGLKGSPTGVVLGSEDPVTTAKVAYEFLKSCDHLKVKGGVVEGKALGPKEVEALSKSKSKAELQADVVALALSPGRNLAGQIKTAGSGIAGAIKALVDRLEAAE